MGEKKTKIMGKGPDVKKGKKIFIQKCKQCHSYEEGKNMQGPTLFGLMGRTSGTVSGFAYTDANKASGIVWDDKIFDEYIHHPKKTIPGTKMNFDGLKKRVDRKNLCAFLKSC